MKQTLSMNLRQVQIQKLSMQMIQSIKMLMLTRTELKQTIDDELKENPALEVDESTYDEADDKGIEDFSKPEAEEPEEEAHFDETEIDWEDYFEDNMAKRHVTGSDMISGHEDISSFEEYTPTQPSLEEHLLLQLRTAELEDEFDYTIGEYLISCIDENGYITADFEEACRQLSTDSERIERILKVIQSFDPPGIGGRDLKECLLIQFAASDIDCPIVGEIIRDHLDLLGSNKYPQIAKTLGVSIDEVQEAADEIRKFSPKPGLSYSGKMQADYITPDVILIEKQPGEYIIQINESGIPRLRISPLARKIINEHKKGGVPKNLYKYVKKKQDSALWLIRSILQRRNTLYKISEAIVNFQKEFLDRGVRHLRPLTLKQLADIVGVHESTVGRVTTGKYIQTPRGIFELKYFFTSGLKTNERGGRQGAAPSPASGEMASSESVRDMIREIIDGENKKKPLSDLAIAEILAKKGIEIARRTVMKYREAMEIPSSSKRKVFI